MVTVTLTKATIKIDPQGIEQGIGGAVDGLEDEQSKIREIE